MNKNRNNFDFFLNDKTCFKTTKQLWAIKCLNNSLSLYNILLVLHTIMPSVTD